MRIRMKLSKIAPPRSAPATREDIDETANPNGLMAGTRISVTPGRLWVRSSDRKSRGQHIHEIAIETGKILTLGKTS